MDLKSFAKGSGILIISNVILKAMNFFLMPIYTVYLTTEMLGISDTITSFTGLLLPICVMGLDSAFAAFYYDRGEKQAEKVFNTVFYVLIIAGSIPILLCCVSSEISGILFKTGTYSEIIIMALISVSLNVLVIPFALNLRMKNKMLLYGIVNMITSFSMIILNIIFVIVLELGTISLILSTMLAHLIQLILVVIVNKQGVFFRHFDISLLKRMLYFAVPLVPGVILSWVLSLSDRYILIYFHSAKEVGLYGVGTRLLAVLNIFISSITMAYTTFAYGSKDEVNAKVRYVKVFDLMVLVLGGISFTLALFSKEIVTFMTTSDYHSSYIVVRDLMFAQLFYGITTIVSYGMLFEKKSIYVLFSNFLGAIVNIVLNLIFVPQYGIAAAAFTTLVGYLLTFVFSYFFSQKLYYCNYKIGKASVFLILLYALSLYFVYYSMAIKIILWIVAAILGLSLYKDIIIEFCTIFMSKSGKGKELS